jgi:hypothetical protein
VLLLAVLLVLLLALDVAAGLVLVAVWRRP